MRECQHEVKVIKILTRKGFKNFPEYRGSTQQGVDVPYILMTRFGEDLHVKL